jgi:ectoine hydroxylase-related dioxygenase (phytanoyl-CoA dioxygenase family)
MLTPAQQQFYQDNGYVVVPALFSADDTARYCDHFMTLRQEPRPNDDTQIVLTGDDPIKRYPRLIKPHQWDAVAMRWMLEPRLFACMTELLGSEPYAAQTMVYFKPPGARGQALHQDNYYLRVRPGTCMAAWLALDDADEANGCLEVVPGSHAWDLLCTVDADTTISFTSVTIPLPPGASARPVPMRAGDVMFFNGSIAHGSQPNTTRDRFRRALIGHYVQGTAEQVSKGYQPLWRQDGSTLVLDPNEIESSVCGVWVEIGGQPAIEMTGQELKVRRRGE